MAASGLLWAVCLGIHMATLGLGSYLYNINSRDNGGAAKGQCPCEHPSYCEPIKDTTRKEVFVFSLNPKHEDWRFYNWDKVTTVVMVGYIDQKLVCLAHKFGSRAVIIANVNTLVLTNKTAREEWVNKQLEIIKDNYLDGVNFDYEDAILKSQGDVRTGYTELVSETAAVLKKYAPTLQISVDVAWSPDCIDLRCYDYLGLSGNSDFLFVMAYDEQSQIFGECIAAANSPYSRTRSGLLRYREIGVPVDKLILGVPWYGYNYPCLSLSQDNVCSIKEVPFRGVNCSDSAGRQFDYWYNLRLLKNSTTGRLWDADAMSPYFNYQDPRSNQMHQVRYDDPESLGYKYQLAMDLNLRGVGMWNAEGVNYTSTLPDDIRAVDQMWDALPFYKRH